MNQVKKPFAAVAAAWGLLVDRPLPTPDGASGVRPSPMGVLVAFPLVGVLLGLFPLVVSGVIALFFNRLAGALFFAFAAAALLWGKDSGRGMALLISYVAARLEGSGPPEALEKADGSLELVLQRPVVMFFSLVAAMASVGMLFVLYYRGAGVWFIAVTTADAFVQGRLCLENDRKTGKPFIRVPGEKGRIHLALAGSLIALLLLLAFPKIAAFVAVAVVWLWFWRELPGGGCFRQGVSADGISLSGFWAAQLMLICGMGLL